MRKTLILILIGLITILKQDALAINHKGYREASTVTGGCFDENVCGKLPLPFEGKIKILGYFGEKNVDVSDGVKFNSGIILMAEKNADVRSVYKGVVSAVFVIRDKYVIIIRHGEYLTVYNGLKNTNVRRGDAIVPMQPLGFIGSDNILEFQLRHGTKKLDPENWLMTMRDCITQ